MRRSRGRAAGDSGGEREARVATDHRWSGKHGIARYASNVLPVVDARLRARAVRSPRSRALPSPVAARLRLDGVTALYSPGFQPLWPSPPALPQYLTVHDLIHLDEPRESSPLKRLYLDLVVRPAIRRARLVFTVSQYSRQRLLAWLDDETFPVVVTGCGSSVRPPTTADGRGAEKGAGSAPYVLYVGNFKPHKNFPLLLSAMAHLDGGTRLVCVGGRPEDLAVDSEQAHVLQERTEFVHGVDDGTLARLYAGAAAVAMPSTIEGFGLPALEGLTCGTSVAYCADAVAEVVGPFGFRSNDPTDPAAFAAALESAMTVDPPAARAGKEWAERYSWDRVAETVAGTLEERLRVRS